MRSRWRAAVSPLVTEVVYGPARQGLVLGVFPTCVYVGFGEHADILALVTSDGLSLPIGLRTDVTSNEIATVSRGGGWGVQQGDTVEIGEGRVTLPRADVVAARVQRIPQVRRWPDASRVLTRGAPALENSALDDRLVGAAYRVAAAALAGPSGGQVRQLVGAGPGLTPSGDDVLCGALLTLRSAGQRGAVASLASEVRDAMHTTTSLSAALLRAACEGHALPEVLQLLDDIGTAAPSSPALVRVLEVGHSSGGDLVAGIAGTCRALVVHSAPAAVTPQPALCHA